MHAIRNLTIGALLFLYTCAAHGQMYFTEVAQDLGVDHYLSQWVVGAGVSFCDFDGDGDDDITLATLAGRPLGFYQNDSGSFHAIPPLVPFTGEAKQILWADVDNDGDKDLFIAAYGSPSKLYRNDGQQSFIDMSQPSGIVLANNFAYGAAWVDYDRDGYLDLFVNERISLSDPYLNQNYLFRNLGNGTFEDVSEKARIHDPGKIPFVGSFLDANNDLWPDLYTANDKLTYNSLFVNSGHGRFYMYAEESGSKLRMNAMCVALGDYDNDGWQDIYISNTPIGNALLRNATGTVLNEDIQFEEVADSVGVGFYGNGWGSNFLDADNDGDLDLYASGSQTGSGGVSSIFYENVGDGSFVIPAAGFVGDTTSSFSNAVGDFNEDGYPDILVQNNPPYSFHLWENQGLKAYNWLKVSLEGVKSNRDGIGARIEIYAKDLYQMRFTHCGIGFLGQNSHCQLFGMNIHETIDSLVVTWPTGHRDIFKGLTVNQRLTIVEGSSTGGEIFVDSAVQLNTVELDVASTQNEFHLFPNPASSQLWVEIPRGNWQHYEIRNALGQLLLRQPVPAATFSIPVGDVPSGYYGIFLLSKEGKSFGKKWQKE